MKIKLFFFFLVIALAILGSLYHNRLRRFYHSITLFDEDKIVLNFRHSAELGFPYRVASRGPKVAAFKEDRILALPETFLCDGHTINTAAHLRERWATGLVVLRVNSPTEAELLYEGYWRGNSRDSRVISWSMGKSIVSALVGIAVGEGRIESILDPVTKYVPELAASGYNNVPIKDILQMSSGVAFDENYFDLFSDIRRMGNTVALGFSINGFVASLHSERPPGVFNHYVSVDTQVLGWLLHNVLNCSVTDYLQEKIWKHGGFEQDLLWMLDNEVDQMELAFGTNIAATRDFARFGWLYLNNGKSPLDGQQLVPEQWIHDSITPDAPHLLPGDRGLSDHDWGYGYQWWIPGGEQDPTEIVGDYLAIGIYNQFIYVNPKLGIVIARNSAYPHYDFHMRESEREAVSCFRAIAKTFANR